MEKKNILDLWEVTHEELGGLIETNPSLRGIVFGYLAEHKLKKMLLLDPRISGLVKYDNHERTEKGDLGFRYMGVPVILEVKSLQTATVKQTSEGYSGRFQCDASDRRTVSLPSGKEIETTCLLVGQFDLLAVNCFAFGQKEWRFAFARNKDLPRSRFRGYSPEDREHLLATLMDVTWPVQPPFEAEPFRLLDQIVSEKTRQKP